MEWTDFLREELFILIPVLYLLGVMLKKSPLADWLIPYCLTSVGILLSFVYLVGTGVETNGGWAQVFFTSVTQGVLCAACSVLAKNMIKQATERDGDDET